MDVCLGDRRFESFVWLREGVSSTSCAGGDFMLLMLEAQYLLLHPCRGAVGLS